MKRILSMLCLVIMVFSCSAMAEENTPEINFRGMKLGSTAAEVSTILSAEGSSLSLSAAHAHLSYLPKDAAYVSVSLSPAAIQNNEHNEDVILISYTPSVEVAGHTTWTGVLCFVRPVVDGVLAENDMDSLFYAGTYALDISAKDDLKKKLTDLYGKPEKGKHNKKECYTWYGANNTAIHMTEHNFMSNFLGLSYVWLGFDDVYQASCAYLDAQPESADAANTAGL